MEKLIFYKIGVLAVHEMECGKSVISFMQGQHSGLPVSFILDSNEVVDPRVTGYESKIEALAIKLMSNDDSVKHKRLIPAVCTLFDSKLTKGSLLSNYQKLSEIRAQSNQT